MKRTDLVKHLAKKIEGQMQHAATPGRFAQGANALPDRREQRKIDQAAGLMPFAVKLHVDLARQLRELAEQEGGNLNALVDRLIRAGLAGSDTPVAAPVKSDAKASVLKVVAKKVVPKNAAEKNAGAPASVAVEKKAAAKVAKKAAAVKPAAKEDKKKAPVTKVAKEAVAKRASASKAPAKKAAAQKVAAKVAKKAVKTKA